MSMVFDSFILTSTISLVVKLLFRRVFILFKIGQKCIYILTFAPFEITTNTLIIA